MNRTLVALLAALTLNACASVPTRDSQSEVREFVIRFVRAVNESNVDDFVACFAPNATAFFPSPANAARRVGREAIRTAVAPNFQRDPDAAPLVPRELTISVDGGTAYVTFDAGIAPLHARRTLVVRRIGEEWLVAHLHASNVEAK